MNYDILKKTMKITLLLIDPSLTVQKVVSLTLDRNRYTTLFAKTLSEAKKLLLDNSPQLVMVSDQVAELNVTSFPKEVETWLRRTHNLPAFVLVTSQDIREARHYQGVLKKPFSPQDLSTLVIELTSAPDPQVGAPRVPDELKFQKLFNDSFSDEHALVEETFKGAETTENPWVEPEETARPAPPRNTRFFTGLHRTSAAEPIVHTEPQEEEVMGHTDSLAFKASLDSHVENTLRDQDLERIVDEVLNRIVPPIVERLVHERLDKLLKEQEQWTNMKV